MSISIASRPSETVVTSDWTELRGRKWLASESGMEAMLSPLDEPLIRSLRLDEPLLIADIGCGGGATSRELLGHSPAGSFVHGFDVSERAIDSARGKGAEGALSFTVMDVANEPPPREFDRMISRLGVMFFEDEQGAFANLLRFLKPGGHFAFAVWGKKEDNPWMMSAREAVESVVPIPPSPPDGPGPFRYAEPGRLLAILHEAGFDDCAAHEWSGELPVGGALTADGAAHFALTSFSFFSELLEESGESAMERARTSLAERFAAHHRDGAVWMKARAHIVTGSRPADRR